MKTNFTFGTSTGKLAQRRSAVELMMTPMIDVVFLLLVFFLAASSFQVAELDFPSELTSDVDGKPSSSATDAPTPPDTTGQENDIIVTVQQLADGTPAYELNGSRLTGIEELQERLRKIVSIKNNVPVVIDPSDDSELQFAIAAFDVAKLSGAIEVYLVAGNVNQ